MKTKEKIRVEVLVKVFWYGGECYTAPAVIEITPKVWHKEAYKENVRQTDKSLFVNRYREVKK